MESRNDGGSSMTMSIIIPNHNEPDIGKMVKEVSRQFPFAQVVVQDDPDGKGKGWAIREGLKKAYGEVICFIDGDLDIHPRMIKRLIPFLDDFDIVVGVKNNDGFMSRRIITWLSRFYIKFLFGVKVDTQTGIKLFKRRALPKWKSDGFLFDVEILWKAKRVSTLMVGVPIVASISRRVSARTLWRTLKESISLWLELRSL